MKATENAISLIRVFEGFRENAYQDVIGVWTIGYGTTRYSDGKAVQKGERISNEAAVSELTYHVQEKIIKPMEKLIRVTLNQNQIDALVSLIYNIGIGNFSESSMLKFINSGEFEKAAGEFSKWRMANGKVINGLERRRGQEAALFRKE